MSEASKSSSTANIIYILYLVGLVLGITAIVGVVMAYINKKDAPAWVQSHYDFQIRTFWIGLLIIVIGVITSALIIGFFIILFWYIWIIIRVVKGMKSLSSNEAHPNPQGWMF